MQDLWLRYTNLIAGILDNIGKFVVMTRDVLLYILVFRIPIYNFKDQLYLVGSKSIFIVLITALVIGMVFSLQITDIFTRFGGESVIGGVLSLAMLRELAPVVSAIVFAGRVGSSISAEISSMKVTQQLDALNVMATSPVYYLAVPRVLASAIMLPILTAFADIISIVGGYLISVTWKGTSSGAFINSSQDMLETSDITASLAKGLCFGIAIALISCYMGFYSEQGAKGVGISTTRAVVYSLVAIFILNYFLTSWLFFH